MVTTLSQCKKIIKTEKQKRENLIAGSLTINKITILICHNSVSHYF